MGLDRFANFLSKSINNEGIEEIQIENNIKKVVATHVVFDLNFLLYQELVNIENEINDIIKTILCLPFSCGKQEIVISLLKNIFNQEHWKPYYSSELETLFDGYNEDEIIQKFIIYITSKIKINSTTNNTLSIIELVIYEKIVNVMVNNIKEIHELNFIQALLIFYDGIPSISKVIEQRRRRIKNVLESNQKKILFKKYFDNLLPNNKNLFENLSKKYISDSDSNIMFDYLKSIKNRFSVDKSIGPSSDFIKNLELFMNIKLKSLLPNIKLYINSSKENGESDFKIFKYISINETSGDYCIHTTDSDLIHQILVQQTYYNIMNKDIGLTVIKYLKNNPNVNNYAMAIDAKMIIKNILELYNNINNTKINNYKIIWDLCLLFFFFGNDHLPSSMEVGPELGLEYFLKRHYMALGKDNIVNLNKNAISINMSNLLLFLEKINEMRKNNITRIILYRFFKTNNMLINLLVDKFSLDLTEIQEFLKTYIIYMALNMNIEDFNKLNPMDLRLILTKDLSEEEKNKYKNIDCFNLNETKQKTLLDSLKLIEDNLDFFSHEYLGLIQYNKFHSITNDPYQDLYNFITEKTTSILTKKYPQYYDHIELSHHLNLINSDKNNPHDYLKKIFHLTTTQFGTMKHYHTDNITYYKYNTTPSLNKIIEFIKNIPEATNMVNIWLQQFDMENVKNEDYLNSTNHHLLITPFISQINIPDKMKSIINTMQEKDPIENLLLTDYDDFDYRNIDIINFLKKWRDICKEKEIVKNINFIL